MTTWLKLGIILAGVALAAGWWLRPRSRASGALLYRTAAVTRGDVVQTVSGSGTLSALTTVDVGSQVSGNILKLHADFNDVVTEGQLLAEIEPTTYEARLFQAEADLLSAQAALELRQLNAKRSAELLARKLIAQSDYDDVAVALRQQEASTQKAGAAVKSARVDRERCKIYSPINGVVLKRAASVGQTVQSNYAVATLFTIAKDLRQMEIEASISEADIGGVEAGQSVTFTVDAFPARSFQGKVRQVRNNSTAANNVVTYPTIVSADNADLKLRPGMTANIVIATARRTGVLRVPNAALRFKAPDGAVVLAATVSQAAPGLDRMPAEIQQRALAEFDHNGDDRLDADERKIMDSTLRNRMATGTGGGGFGPPDGGPGGPPPGHAPGDGGAGTARTGSSSSSSAGNSPPVTLHVVLGQSNAAGHAAGALQAVSAYLGVSDGTNTEVLGGVNEGALVAIGTVSAQAAAATAPTSGTNNLFGPPRPPGANKK